MTRPLTNAPAPFDFEKEERIEREHIDAHNKARGHDVFEQARELLEIRFNAGIRAGHDQGHAAGFRDGYNAGYRDGLKARARRDKLTAAERALLHGRAS